MTLTSTAGCPYDNTPRSNRIKNQIQLNFEERSSLAFLRKAWTEFICRLFHLCCSLPFNHSSSNPSIEQSITALLPILGIPTFNLWSNKSLHFCSATAVSNAYASGSIPPPLDNHWHQFLESRARSSLSRCWVLTFKDLCFDETSSLTTQLPKIIESLAGSPRNYSKATSLFPTRVIYLPKRTKSHQDESPPEEQNWYQCKPCSKFIHVATNSAISS